jgi:motility quorum-sensing regulator / GCU-specific mRNA interferase toxin
MQLMEKHKSHYDLEAIKKKVLCDGIFTFTALARRGVDTLGLSEAEAVDVVLSLQRSQLFKSMTTHSDHSVWQDVYHAICPNGKIAYIKLTLQDGALVIQFKEK